MQHSSADSESTSPHFASHSRHSADNFLQPKGKAVQIRGTAQQSRAEPSNPWIRLSCRLGKIRGRRMYMYLESLSVVLWLLTASLQIPRCDFPKDLDTV